MKKTITITCAIVAIASFSCKRETDIKPGLPTTDSLNSSIALPSTPPVATLVAGFKDHAGYTNASGASAKFNQPYGILVNSDGTLLVADQKNGAVRKISNSVVSTVVKNSNLVGVSNIAGTKDGTIALNDQGFTVLYKGGNLNYIDVPGCQHCSTGGLSKSADGTFFWYPNNLYDGESAVYLESLKPNGDPGGGPSASIATSEDALVAATAVSTTLNDNKFITLQQTIYEVTHSGSVQHILPGVTFDGLTDITANKDGTKLYVADKGDIKLITRCSSSCPTVLTILLAHVDATGLALSNSEKVLFFTSLKHHTISKINLQ